jgi:hypothetical protein
MDHTLVGAWSHGESRRLPWCLAHQSVRRSNNVHHQWAFGRWRRRKQCFIGRYLPPHKHPLFHEDAPKTFHRRGEALAFKFVRCGAHLDPSTCVGRSAGASCSSLAFQSQPPDTVERVFQARAEPEVAVEIPERAAALEPATPILSAGPVVSPEPDRPRTPKKPTPKPPSEKKKRAPALSDAFGAEAAAIVDLARQHREQNPKIAETTTKAAPAKEKSSELDASEADQKDAGTNWGWGPGERWKRRLRHLR